MTDVYLNENYIGDIENPKEFVRKVRSERRKSAIPGIINVYFDENSNEVRIESSKGRARRPVIVVENGKSLLTEKHMEKLGTELKFSDLVKQGIIEYLDASEEENALVALYEKDITTKHTHLEISPIAMLGICASLMPYSNFCSSSRLIKGNKMQKQSLGLYTANYLLRMDTDTNVLHYPQVPIVRSFTSEIFPQSKYPYGQNIVIAIMSYEGYNMQDSIIVNKGSIERGFGRSTYFRPYSIEELRYSGGLKDEIVIPDKEVKGYRSEKDYRYLEEDGIIFPEAKIKENDVIIGKISPPRFLGGMEEFSIAANIRRESSVSVKHGEKGIIDFVVVTENDEGNKLVQVRVRETRTPEIGDKFASRHEQKGVIGLIVPEEDMPFTAAGIKPDIIFSPFSVPSRMTVSHMLEILGGKVASLSGKYIDGTVFDSKPEDEMRKELLELGFRENSTETMYNGMTGEVYKAKIYIGNIYYLRLRHMVANRLHSRASGKVQLLTRQPIEGRARGGGLRLGEMEKDCFVAHGASLLLKERFDSDKTLVYVCENCGLMGMYDHFKQRKTCPKCGSSTEVNAIELSYAFKLLLDELKALCIYPRLNLKNKY
ncbi:MAG: DNA-directed RNA polymerase subunit B [Candidatus Nanoarchaeia archaeon]